MKLQFDTRGDEVEQYKKQVIELSEQIQINQERENSTSRKMDKEIYDLRASLDEYKTEHQLREKEKSETESLLSKLKLQLTSRGDEVEQYKKQVNELSERLLISEERENNTSIEMDKEIYDLRASLDGYKTELQLSNRDKSETEILVNKLKLQLTSRGDEVERYKKQVNELDEQLQISQERENSTSTKMDKEIRDLRVSLDGYKTELELREKEKSETEILLNKLKLKFDTRGDEVERYKKQANELGEQLQISQERENNTSIEMDKEIYDLRASLDDHKTELQLRVKEKMRQKVSLVS